jgi:hypothetical protein
MRKLDFDYEVVYKFKGVDKLHCDLKGNFFFDSKPIKKIYNNGSLSVLVGKSKKGIIKLRKIAYKDKIEINTCPF